jgi:hypothetical protein
LGIAEYLLPSREGRDNSTRRGQAGPAGILLLLLRGAVGPAPKLSLLLSSKPTWAGEGECYSSSDSSSGGATAGAAGARAEAGAAGTASTNS